MRELTYETLVKLLEYCRESGQFRWKVDRGGKARAGKAAGKPHHNQYVQIRVFGRLYYAHRLAWFLVHSRWPKNELDHINGDRTDNRIENLRECTRAENGQNQAKRKDNASGFIGVSWDVVHAKWRADIRLSGRTRYLGLFVNAEDAHAAYLAAKMDLHKFQTTPRMAAPSNGEAA